MTEADDIPSATTLPVGEDVEDLLQEIDEGQRIYYKRKSGRMYGPVESHATVESVDVADGEYVVETTSGKLINSDDTDGVLFDDGDGTHDFDGNPKRVTRLEVYPPSITDDLYEWEIHLVVSRVHESSDDVVRYPEAPEAGEDERVNAQVAIDLARRRAKRNPPEVGPTYREQSVEVDHE